MRNESDCCSIIKNSFLLLGEECFKIPDPSGLYAKTIARPFDMIATLSGHPVFIEAKFMKGMQAFALSRIEDHQIEALKSWRGKIPGSESWIVLGVNAGRADNRIYIFKNILDIAGRRMERRNYLKKDLEQLPYMKVQKNLVDLLDLKSTNL